MKIHLLSDLHMEIDRSGVLDAVRPVDADCLVLAGDICKTQDDLKALLDRAGPQRYIYIPGNHEYYGEHDPPPPRRAQQTVCDRRVIGTTLWFPAEETPRQLRRYLNDFRHLSVEQIDYWHRSDVQWLTDTPADVIVTHHIPTVAAVAPRYANDQLNCFYVVPGLAERIQPKLWLFGHSHCSTDIVVGKTRLVSNPKGYFSENKSWDPEFTVNL